MASFGHGEYVTMIRLKQNKDSHVTTTITTKTHKTQKHSIIITFLKQSTNLGIRRLVGVSIFLKRNDFRFVFSFE